MAMSIANYIGLVGTFTFPYNPQSFDDSTDSDHSTKHIPYSDRNIQTAAEGGISPKMPVLQGHFSGTDKRTNYRHLHRHLEMETHRFKKLYFEADKFFLGIGKGCKGTNTGGRTNFIDYVASFECAIGIQLGDTQRTTGTNAGNVPTYVEEIVRIVSSGASDVTVTSGDVVMTIPSSALTTNDKFVFKFIQRVNAGGDIYTTEFNYVGLGVDSGTTTSTSSFKLVQTGQNFLTTIKVGDLVRNTTDNSWTLVTKVDGDTTVSLRDNIMAASEAYIIYHQTNQVQLSGGTALKIIA